ncbi:(-)-germacrene D synthase-like [Dorcoceras hygrometricum]|uniref:(-)-germacrene D synthase-like n=1 Tax=Dorcoceras hygrometricum TaxID=472368 RepID=A0A2Z7DCN8_9LAMI|nr:(-)-germacrene D synthase-like [Dorcoceras hygrometricum]
MIHNRDLCDPWLPSTDLGPILGDMQYYYKSPIASIGPKTHRTVRVRPEKIVGCKTAATSPPRRCRKGGAPVATRVRHAMLSPVHAPVCGTLQQRRRVPCAQDVRDAPKRQRLSCPRDVRDDPSTSSTMCAGDMRDNTAMSPASCAAGDRTGAVVARRRFV